MIYGAMPSDKTSTPLTEPGEWWFSSAEPDPRAGVVTVAVCFLSRTWFEARALARVALGTTSLDWAGPFGEGAQ